MSLHYSGFGIVIFEGFVKSRHSREGGNPHSQLLKKNGFPTKNFGNDSLEEDFKGRTFYE